VDECHSSTAGLVAGATATSPPAIYFFFEDFGAACERALPAAFFDGAPVRPSRRTLLAALAAEGEV
jgi:hypothetical protein